MRDIAAIRADIAFAITSPRRQTGEAITAALDEFEHAVEARYEARLRQAANSPNVDDHTRKAGHFFADAVAGWPTGSRLRFGPTEGLAADVCQFHSSSGVPCSCGHDGAADCHPGARRTT